VHHVDAGYRVVDMRQEDALDIALAQIRARGVRRERRETTPCTVAGFSFLADFFSFPVRLQVVDR
jgi:hypothetical protein